MALKCTIPAFKLEPFRVFKGISRVAVLSTVLMLLPTGGHAQHKFWIIPDSVESRRLILVSGAAALGYTSSMYGLNTLWYADVPRSGFHLFNDNADWLQMDKAGHAFGAYQISRMGYQAVRWTGSDERKSVWAATGFAILYMTSFEVMDGFSAGWGFSPGDALVNVAGAALFASQQLGWEDQRITLKFGYSQSGLAQYRPNLLGANAVERILKDYNGQQYWLSVNPSSFGSRDHSILPWLNIALGYSGQGMLGGSANPDFNESGMALPDMARYRQVYVSLDVDLTRIQTRSGFLRTLFSVINVIKVPAPALEWSRGGLEWHWLLY
jgi:uncharacterized protein YfiM (DUF2279 family)